jgi:hypothetical protein
MRSRPTARALLAAVAGLAAAACGGAASHAGSAPDAQQPPAAPPAAPPAGAPPAATPGWVTVASEDFEHADLGSPAWHPDPVPDDGPYADGGSFWTARGVTPPAAHRLSQPFGAGGWLTAESYTRDAATPFSSLLSVVPDPADPSNKVLRLASPRHTDATVIRSSEPLPERYRVSLRVGFAKFGDGLPGLNGYPAPADAGPWRPDVSASTQNGFYWLAILDAMPRPHNNTWIHHHRKLVMDSDNDYPAWMETFDGHRFVKDGEHPATMLAIDGQGPRAALTGEPLLPYGGGAWQPSSTARAVDSYLDGEWYRASIERDGTVVTLEMSGRFRHGGLTTYRATIDAAAHCVWHYNRSAAEDASACVDASSLPEAPGHAAWPAGATWPDWLMFGDPHVNFYAGEVYYDDVKLEVWRP